MIDEPEPTTEQQEMLVAYLDGELTEAEVKEFERELARNPQLEEARRQMEQTWSALDDWEPGDPGRDSTNAFTQATLSLAAESLRPDAAAPWSVRNLAAARWCMIAAAIAAALVGYNATAHWLGRTDAQLLQQLPLIVHVDRYRSVEDLEYLRAVASRFSAAESSDAPLVDFHVAEMELVDANVSDRQAWLESLDEHALFELRAKHERYHKLDVDTKQRLEELHEELQTASDRVALQRAMLLYTQWLSSLSTVQRTSLLSMDGEQRLSALETALEAATNEGKGQSEALVIDTPLTPGDLQVLRRWSRDYIEANRELLTRRLPLDARRTWDNASATRQWFMLFNMLTRPFRPLGPVEASELDELKASLSDAASEALGGRRATDRELLAEWLQRATFAARPGWAPAPTLAALQAFYRTLSPGKRRYLDQLPPAQSREALIAMYMLDRRANRRPRSQQAAPSP